MAAIASTSLWHLTGPRPTGGDTLPTHVGTVVVGAGLAGLATALMLSRDGRDVVVIDAADLGGRTTSRTTGKVSLLQGTVAAQVRRHAGDAALAAYLAANSAGSSWLREELAPFPGAWEDRAAYTYATTAEGDVALRQEEEAMAAGGHPVEAIGPDHGGAIGLPLPVTGALRLADQAQLHPMFATAALVDGIRRSGGRLVGRCRLTGVHVTDASVRIQTDRGRLLAEHLVLATGTPALDRSLLFATLTPQRQAVVAFRLPEGTPPPQGMYLSVDPTGRSLRSALDRDGAPAIVVGGGDLVTGRADAIGDLRDALVGWTAEHYPGAEPITWWAAQDYRMSTRIPFAGPIAGGRGRVFAVTGFAKWGMANSAAAALAMAGQLRGEPPEWHRLLGARRPGLRDIAETVKVNLETGSRLISGWVAAASGGPPAGDEPQVARRGTRPVARSTVDGRTCRVSAVCTHLGGIVRWNDAEQTWDCPLHGSRFTREGAVIEGPATRDLESLDTALTGR